MYKEFVYVPKFGEIQQGIFSMHREQIFYVTVDYWCDPPKSREVYTFGDDKRIDAIQQFASYIIEFTVAHGEPESKTMEDDEKTSLMATWELDDGMISLMYQARYIDENDLGSGERIMSNLIPVYKVTVRTIATAEPEMDYYATGEDMRMRAYAAYVDKLSAFSAMLGGFETQNNQGENFDVIGAHWPEVGALVIFSEEWVEESQL